MEPTAKVQRISLREILSFFFIMGMTAFGGPVAHLAVLEREAVRRRGWMTQDEFIDVMGLLNLIPGPNSTQMVMYFGLRLRGILGLMAAGLGFILPAGTLTLVVTWAYMRYGTLPQGQALLFGIQPIVVAIIVFALWSFLPKGVTDWRTGSIFALALLAGLLGINEVTIILLAGVMGWLWFSRTRPRAELSLFVPVGVQGLWSLTPTLGGIFAIYSKMALTLYGTGYLLLAYMKGDLVDSLGWLTEQQLLDAIAIGQMTPGPFLTTATSTGMLIAGWPGALTTTLAIFLPSFFLVGLLGGRVEALRQSEWGKQALRGVNAAIVAVLLLVGISLAGQVFDHWLRVALLGMGLLALWKGMSSMGLIALGGVVGLLWHLVR